jgi:hypothetical protein
MLKILDLTKFILFLKITDTIKYLVFQYLSDRINELNKVFTFKTHLL